MNERERIREVVSIPQYFEDVIVPQLNGYYADGDINFEYKPYVKCPLHFEDTPSLRYYEDTKTFGCFGCRRGGDVVNLHIYFIEAISGEKPSYAEAIKWLSDRYVKGKDVGVANKKKVDTNLNSTVDLIKFGRFVREMEMLLKKDNMVLEDKVSIYNDMDYAKYLVKKNLATAKKCEEEIDKLVRYKIAKNRKGDNEND